MHTIYKNIKKGVLSNYVEWIYIGKVGDEMLRLVDKWLFPTASVKEQRLKAALEHKTIVITGASSGIGRAVAEYMAQLRIPLTLIVVARREQELLALKETYESEQVVIHTICADLRNVAERQTLLEFLHTLPNGLDIVVSNAGLSIRRSLMESLDRMHDFTRTMAINYEAPVQLLLAVIPLLAKSRGHIINVSTINARLHPVPNWSAYVVSKGAFDTWLQAVTPELLAQRITTSTLYLPLVRTPMIAPTKQYASAPAMTVEQVVRIVCRACYEKKRRYAPWWLAAAELMSLIGRPVLDIFYNRRSR